jgi:hypothetical protein
MSIISPRCETSLKVILIIVYNVKSYHSCVMHVLLSDETGNIPQIVYYQSGVGSESDFLGSISPTTKAVIRKFLSNFQQS